MKSKKTKKGLIITGVAVACVGIAAIAIVNGSSKVEKDDIKSLDNSSATIVLSSDVTPNSIKENVVSSAGKAFDPETESSRSESLTTYSKTSSTPSKPIIEGDSKNGSQLTNSALTDKNKKPSYTTTPKASTGSSTAAKKTSSKSSSTSSKKSAGGSTGELDPNKAWGTGGEETTVGNPGDELTGDKVGIMD